MKAVLRAAVTTLVLTIAVGAGVVAAASPAPTVGGTLEATPSEKSITVTSHGSVPATVRLTADAIAMSDPGPFTLNPEEARTITYTGPDAGYVSATFSVAALQGTESGSATLSVTLRPYFPPFNWTPVGIGLLLLVALLLLTIRLRPWRWRIHVTTA